MIRFDHGGRTFAVSRWPDDEYFATDGYCTRLLHARAGASRGRPRDNQSKFAPLAVLQDLAGGVVAGDAGDAAARVGRGAA